MKEMCYLEDEVKTKTIECKKCKRVKDPVIRTYAVNKPVEEYRTKMVQREDCTECEKDCIEEPCTCKVARMKKDICTTKYKVTM